MRLGLYEAVLKNNSLISKIYSVKKLKKDNIVNFPSSLSDGEKEVEAILFAAEEPLDIESIESKN